MIQPHEDEPEALSGGAQPVEVDDLDILDDSEEVEYRHIDALFDDDPFADDGDLDFADDEPSW